MFVVGSLTHDLLVHLLGLEEVGAEIRWTLDLDGMHARQVAGGGSFVELTKEQLLPKIDRHELGHLGLGSVDLISSISRMKGLLAVQMRLIQLVFFFSCLPPSP